MLEKLNVCGYKYKNKKENSQAIPLQIIYKCEPNRSRTYNRRLRRAMLYPIELWVRKKRDFGSFKVTGLLDVLTFYNDCSGTSPPCSLI